ncbi:hypothetical protein I6F40_11415 [Pseudoalteromonas sp. SWXJ133]|uniref:hypothetical protein n=1 Tax=Pseudoalteromonas sp. SWXJ133 TaxID=2792069 RepID=UPI0018CD331B|nr:hypothetical protein [Pseudoalteromonas sp. SWXJ133]MBH0020955.1 hypothetical protein [Pseudoalteromonas sp. SWXJ133]
MTVEFKEMEKGICLFVDGTEVTHYIREVPASHIIGDVSYVLYNDFELENDEIDDLLNLSLSEIPACFDFHKEDYKTINGASIAISIDCSQISLEVEHDLEKWANSYSFIEFNTYFTKLLTDGPFNSEFIYSVKLYLDSYKIENQSILPELTEAYSYLKKCYLEAEKILIEQTRDDVFIKVFEFPPEYKNICSQYLIWFGEFLQNLGIDATVSTNQSKNQTQLIVSPDECPELLTEIEKLFYQYLSLPYSELLPPESNLTPQELHVYHVVKMQVQHLETQIQMKDSVIASYQATNRSLINEISEKDSELMLINSLKEEGKFEVLGGILKVNKVQKIGKNDNASIDLSKIFKLFNKK